MKDKFTIVQDNQKRCFRCKNWKDLGEFNKSPKLSGGVAKMCRDCYNSHPSVIECERRRSEHRKACFETDLEYYFRIKKNYIKAIAKRQRLKFDLDAEYLFNLWKQQNGLCYYSNIIMKSNGKENGFQAWESPSLDRKIPELGYVKGNVVWCCSAINSFKSQKNSNDFLQIVNQIKWRLPENKA